MNQSSIFGALPELEREVSGLMMTSVSVNTFTAAGSQTSGARSVCKWYFSCHWLSQYSPAPSCMTSNCYLSFFFSFHFKPPNDLSVSEIVLFPHVQLAIRVKGWAQ